MSQNVHSVSHIGAGLLPEYDVWSAALVGCIRFLYETDSNLPRKSVPGARDAGRIASSRDGTGLMVPAANSTLRVNSKTVLGGMEMKLFHSRYEFCPTARLAMVLAAALLPVFLLPVSTRAQVASSTLSGTVYDESGAVVPGAQVVVKNDATATTREMETSGAGSFSFPALMPGSYTLTVTAKGFKTFEQKNIKLSEAESRSLPNLRLQVGVANEMITVETGVEAIAPVDTGANGTTLNETMVTNIAIQGRDAAELIKLMPGMGLNRGLGQDPWTSLNTSSNSGPVGQFSASGTQPNGGLQLTVDGGLIVDTGNMGTQVANINQDQTAELTIRNSAFNAEYSRGPVTVEATGKSGASQFHGGAYLYTRNSIFNAEDASLKAASVAKPDDRYYYPGGTLGGPVIIPGSNFNKNRDKLFFFTAYEYMKQNPSGTLHQLFVPTADMLGTAPGKNYADFSPAYLSSIHAYGPVSNVPCQNNSGFWNYSTFCGTPTGQTITNGQIPLSLLDPNALALAKLFPAPNIDPATHGGNNFQFIDSPPINRWEFKARADYNITQKTRLYVSYNRQDETDVNNFGVWWNPNSTLPYPTEMPAALVSSLWSTSVMHVFTPALTNETTFNYTSFINPVRASNIGKVNPTNVGYNVQNPFSPSIKPMIPNLLSWECANGNGGCFPGFWAPAYSSGFAGGAFGALKRVPSLSDNLSWVKGTHTMKFGFFWAHGGNQQTEGAWDSNNGFPQGRFQFAPYAFYSTNNTLADFVIGHPVGFAQTSSDPLHTLWYNEIAFFAQDSWKATRRLTLTFGIRFDREGQWYPTDSNSPGMAVWDPTLCPASSAPGPKCSGPNLPGFTWHGINKSIPLSGFPSRFTPDPRVGAAFDIFGNGRTVVRGGYGMYRYQLAYNDVAGALDSPLGIQAFQTTCTMQSLAQIATPGCLPTSAAGSLPAASSGLSISALQKGDNRTPVVQNWTFLIDQRAPWNSLFEIGYVGSHTSNMLIAAGLSNVNHIPLGALFAPDPVTGITYYCQGTPSATCKAGGPPSTADYTPYLYNSVSVNTHGSYSNYHALQAMWQKQKGRSTYMVNYTFSKVLGIRDGQTNNGAGNGSVIDVFNLNNNYGVLAYDHTHIFNTAYIIGLPSLHSGNSFAKGAANGWQVSGVLQFQSGAPFQPNVGGNFNPNWPAGVSNQSILGTNADTLVPVLTCNPGKGLTAGQYFNPSCFAVPTRGQNGNVIMPYFKGPAYFDTDLSLYKTFNVTERQHLEFRIQAFNFINHALPTFQFGGTNLNFNAPNNGETGKAPITIGRRVMELAIKYNF